MKAIAAAIAIGVIFAGSANADDATPQWIMYSVDDGKCLPTAMEQEDALKSPTAMVELLRRGGQEARIDDRGDEVDVDFVGNDGVPGRFVFFRSIGACLSFSAQRAGK